MSIRVHGSRHLMARGRPPAEDAMGSPEYGPIGRVPGRIVPSHGMCDALGVGCSPADAMGGVAETVTVDAV